MMEYLQKHWKLILITSLSTVGIATVFFMVLVVGPFYYYLPELTDMFQEIRQDKIKSSPTMQKYIENGEIMAESDARITRAFYLENYERAEELLREIIDTGEASPGAYMKMFIAIRLQVRDIDEPKIRKKEYNRALGYLERGIEKYPEAEALQEKYKWAKSIKPAIVNSD